MKELTTDETVLSSKTKAAFHLNVRSSYVCSENVSRTHGQDTFIWVLSSNTSFDLSGDTLLPFRQSKL